MNVGVMKDNKLRDLRASHTLGWSWYWNTWVCLKKDSQPHEKTHLFLIF
jgi:hypothetical protein